MNLSPELTVVMFGLLASASWGSGDFLGGLASRRVAAVNVLALAHITNIILLVLAVWVSQEAFPPMQDMFWGASAGMVGTVGLAFFYRALANGQMGITAPITGVIATAIPVLVGALQQGLASGIQMAGFALALMSIFLISYSDGPIREFRSLRYAIAGAVGFGFFFVLLAQVESNAIFWPMIGARVASITTMVASALLMGTAEIPRERRMLLMILPIGLLDMGGNIFYIIAERSGRLDMAAVLSSLYPAMPILLAWLFLRERITRVHGVGILVALTSIALIVSG